jgi:PadR family transcriptional regulator, regulatory protein PadR
MKETPVLMGHEEIFLLIILKLEENAYGVTIRRAISRQTGKEWSAGAVYDHLYRMENRGWVESSMSIPVKERGGRSRRIFRVRKNGLLALEAHKKIRDRLWEGMSLPLLDSES